MNINVLGTEYSIEFRDKWTDAHLENNTGYCDPTAKKIVVVGAVHEVEGAVESFGIEREATIRHEIVHAFFYESGLNEWYGNECLVDWIAYQFPKMLKAMHEAGGLPEYSPHLRA